MRLSKAIELFTEHSSVEKRESTTLTYKQELRQFCRYMRDPMIMRIAPEDVTRYLKESLDLGWKKNSLTAPSIALRKFFQYWGLKGYPVLNYQLLPVVHKEGVEPRVADIESLKKVLALCEGTDIYSIRNRAIILMLADTGMRNGELCSMNTDIMETQEISEGQHSYIVRTEKVRGGKTHRRIFWYEETNTALNRWLVARDNFKRMYKMASPGALFVTIQVSHSKIGNRMTPYTIGLMLRRLSEEAHIPTLNAHSLRHLFGATAAEHGLNNSNISDLMGHASLESSFVYTHLRGKNLENAHRKIKRKPS